MIKYQIRFCDSKGDGSFTYVDVKNAKDAPKAAAEQATKYINEQKERSFGFLYTRQYKSKRIVHVWEYDTNKHAPKKDGHRFKLQLGYVEATYTDGSKSRREWYDPA